jgi:MFS transporter, PAT family, beta-lactamase induction signal transducer AmpG
MQKAPIAKLTLLGSLYVSQFLPFVFFGQALPVYLRQQGMSLELIGALGLLSLPWALKFLWAPYIDRIHLTRRHHYRSWIIVFQCLLAGNLLLCAFLDIRSQFIPLLFLIFLGCTIASSQDIATDGLAVTILKPSERGIGNGIQNAGNKLGAIIGGGGALILLEKIGWRNSLMVMAASIMLLLLPALCYSEPNSHQTAQNDSPSLQPIWKFLRRPGMKGWLVVLLMYMIGEKMATRMLRPLFVDLGLSLGEIGWILGIVSYTAGLMGALMAGVFMNRLGRKRSLIGFALLQTIAIAFCILPAVHLSQRPILYFVSIILETSHAMAGTAIFTMMMDISHQETAGTDFTVQSSVVFLGGIMGMVAGGLIAGSIGYVGVFMIAFAVALAGTWMVAKNFHTGQTLANSK